MPAHPLKLYKFTALRSVGGSQTLVLAESLDRARVLAKGYAAGLEEEFRAKAGTFSSWLDTADVVEMRVDSEIVVSWVDC